MKTVIHNRKNRSIVKLEQSGSIPLNGSLPEIKHIMAIYNGLINNNNKDLMKIKEGFVLRTLGKEQIVAGEGIDQVNFNKLISLNSSAAYLWKEVEGKEFDEQTLVKLLLKEYDVDENSALADVHKLINSWVNVGIIEK